MKHLLVSYHTCPTEEPGTHLAGGMNILLRGFLLRTQIPTEVVTRSLGDYECIQLTPCVRIHRLPCRAQLPWTREQAWECLPHFAQALRDWLGDRRPRACTGHYWMSGYLMKQLHLPGSIMFHTLQAQKGRPETPLEQIRLEWEHQLIKHYLSAHLHWHDLNNARSHYPRLKGVVVRPGIDWPSNTPSAPPGPPWIYGWAARNDPIKNLEEALRWLPADCQLLVAGTWGPERSNVRYLGPLPHQRMGEFYGQIHQLLNLSRYETFGLSLLEGLAHGASIGVLPQSDWARRLRRLALPHQPGLLWQPEQIRLAQGWAQGFAWVQAITSWERWILRLGLVE